MFCVPNIHTSSKCNDDSEGRGVSGGDTRIFRLLRRKRRDAPNKRAGIQKNKQFKLSNFIS